MPRSCGEQYNATQILILLQIPTA